MDIGETKEPEEEEEYAAAPEMDEGDPCYECKVCIGDSGNLPEPSEGCFIPNPLGGCLVKKATAGLLPQSVEGLAQIAATTDCQSECVGCMGYEG